MIQDYILLICGIAFGYALVPQIIYNYKNKIVLFSWQTVIITTLFLIINSIIVYTLRLWWTCGITVITSALWLTILIQKYFYSRIKRIYMIEDNNWIAVCPRCGWRGKSNKCNIVTYNEQEHSICPKCDKERKTIYVKEWSKVPFWHVIKTVRIGIKWWDFWVGFFLNRKKGILYVCPIPCVVLSFKVAIIYD